jgi:hypothetical protein
MTYPSKTVFLSYAHGDQEAVIRIYEDLRAAGLEPWMDKFSLGPGDVWKSEIDKAVRHSGAFLSLISRQSLDRGGILAGEMKLALDLRSQRLDDGGILIPVRLENCDLPNELHDLQALDWYLPGGPEKLTSALAPLLRRPPFGERLRAFAASRWGVVAAAIFCIGVGMGVYRTMSGMSLSTYESFLHSRPGSPSPPPSNTNPQIGVTVWRVTEDNSAGDGACRFLRFSRQPLAQPVHTGDRLRLDIQTSREGHIYVISREIDGAGQAEPAELLFPVSSVNNGNNRIAPGSALMIPPASDVCSTLQLTHAGAAEQVSVVFSDKPLDKLPASDKPYSIDPAVEAAITASAAVSTQAGSSSPPDARGIELPDSESRHLDYASSGPDAVFTSTRTSGPVIATFNLKTLK